MRKYATSISLFIAFFLSVSIFAQVDPASKLPFDAKVITGKLENGLTYYIRENKKPEKKVELRLVIKVGSIMEDDDQQGLAHMAEHMAFNGTKNFKKNDIVSYLQSIGVEFGNDLNAYTSFDETVKLWDTKLQSEVKTLRGHTEKTNDVAYSYDGKLIASCSDDKTIKIWRIS